MRSSCAGQSFRALSRSCGTFGGIYSRADFLKAEETMAETYSGQVVLVAGGTGGLGQAVSIAFLEEGATVVVTYRRQSTFEALRQAAGAHAARLEGYSLDATNEAAIQQMVSSVATKHGRLDGLT